MQYPLDGQCMGIIPHLKRNHLSNFRSLYLDFPEELVNKQIKKTDWHRATFKMSNQYGSPGYWREEGRKWERVGDILTSIKYSDLNRRWVAHVVCQDQWLLQV